MKQKQDMNKAHIFRMTSLFYVRHVVMPTDSSVPVGVELGLLQLGYVLSCYGTYARAKKTLKLAGVVVPWLAVTAVLC